MNKPILLSKNEDEQKKELSEIMAVMTSLRHDCKSVKAPDMATKIISKKTGLTRSRVKDILVTIAKQL